MNEIILPERWTLLYPEMGFHRQAMIYLLWTISPWPIRIPEF